MTSLSPMSSVQFATLLALSASPNNAYAVFQQILDDNGLYGIYIRPVTIYKTLARLEAQHQVETYPEPHTGLRTYTLTKHGHTLLKGELFRLEHATRLGRSRLRS